MEIYANIRELAKQKGYSIKRIEELCGWSDSTISKFKNPQMDRLIKVADVLGVSLDELCGRKKYNDKTLDLTTEQYQALELYKTIPPMGRGAVLSVMRSLAGTVDESQFSPFGEGEGSRHNDPDGIGA